MATLMMEHGADIRYIQAMLGHAKLDTTQIYTRVAIRKLKEVHDKTHPARLERQKNTPNGDDTPGTNSKSEIDSNGQADHKPETDDSGPS